MSVVCQANALSDTFQDQPVVIVEVLSESTRRLDDGEKRDAYFMIPSLTHYILLEQEIAVAVVYQRVDQRFKRHEFTDLDDVISMDNLNLSLPLRISTMALSPVNCRDDIGRICVLVWLIDSTSFFFHVPGGSNEFSCGVTRHTGSRTVIQSRAPGLRIDVSVL
ncbi:MAG: Uma2 family endonuclease [Planctomycetaceae bacterium]